MLFLQGNSQKSKACIYEISVDDKISKVDVGYIELTEGSLHFSGKMEDIKWNVKNIKVIQIEGNNRLHFVDRSNVLHRFRFEEESPLKWHFFLNYMKGEPVLE